MIAISPTQITIAGVVILVVIGAACLWWTVRAVMGWHSGRTTYWLSQPSDDDSDDDDDTDGGDIR